MSSRTLPRQVPADNLVRKLKSITGWLVSVVVFVFVVGLVTDVLFNPNYFQIKQLTLTGDAAHVDREVLHKTVKQLIDGNYFSLDSKNIILALQKIPWVETVRLRRQWPGTLLIHIQEYQPLALWGNDRWLTTSAKLVRLPLTDKVLLPQLNGPDARVETVWQQYKDWSVQFSSQGLRIQSMSLSEESIYQLTLASATRNPDQSTNFEMIMVADNANKQLRAFLASYRLSMLEHPDQIKTVDLRYASGFSILRYVPEQTGQLTVLK